MIRKRHETDEPAVKGQPGADAQAKGMDCAECAEEQQIADEMRRLTEEGDKAARERDEFLEVAKRLKADFENYKRLNRTAREDAWNDGVRDTLQKFLPVLDNLERAALAEGGAEALREGVQLVLKQLNTILANAGVEEIAADGCSFDPNLHHAVMQEASGDSESGKVVAVLQKGYTHCGRVLRHSMVKVAE